MQTQVEGLTKWMDEMDVFLHAEDPAAGDIPALQAQLQESQVSALQAQLQESQVSALQAQLQESQVN